MNNFKIYLLILAVVGLGISSCQEDTGNYNYSDINEITISNMDSVYNKLVGDTITIIPDNSFTLDDSNDPDAYTYQWMYLLDTNVGTTPDRLMKVIATTRDLKNFPLALEPGSYDLYYRVTDKKTGVQWQTRCKLNMTTAIYEGFLVMNDVDGKMRLDMLSYRDSAYVFYNDVLKMVGCELPEQEQPIKVVCYTDANADGYAIYLLTQTGTNRIHPETFRYLPAYNIRYQMLGKIPDNFKADNLVGYSNSGIIKSDGNLYNYYRATNVLWGTPVNTLDGISKFHASPWIAQIPAAGSTVFDEDTKSFYKLETSATKCGQLPAGNLTSYTNTGKDLVYLEYCANFTSFYSVLFDKGNRKYHVLRFLNTGVQEIYKEITGPDLDKVQFFAACMDIQSYLFYCTYNKVYQYDMGSGTTKLMLDAKEDKITCMKFQEITNTIGKPRYAEIRTKLIVCTYNESKKEGKMTLYRVPPVNGNLIEYESYSGFNKIVSIAYRTR